MQVSAQLFSQDSLKLISRQFTFTEGPVAEDVTKPNGIVGSADGKYLYVADIERNKIYRYTIDKTVISEAKPRSLTRVLME
ncbi:hypothetical protein RG47T_5178 [Mucilaginibacter polytrichastri]|uniref:SMP-30/Gluconolactonase/LRE-like region domain-containing protein n=1 Tax=Mucilaginibacter polytrichastri TaxID=1302689 RepID=A0A1Q6A6Q0_9SPHI|nr:hypothetical protein RG47T_5178 [Mucilaginibacter polytrichastri]